MKCRFLNTTVLNKSAINTGQFTKCSLSIFIKMRCLKAAGGWLARVRCVCKIKETFNARFQFRFACILFGLPLACVLWYHDHSISPACSISATFKLLPTGCGRCASRFKPDCSLACRFDQVLNTKKYYKCLSLAGD